MKNIFLLGIVAAGAYVFLSKKNFAKSANFSFEKMSMNLKKKQIYVTLGVSNPTGQQLLIKSIVGNLIMNGTVIAAIESFVPTKISATAKSSIKLQLIPSAAGIFQQAKIFIQNILKKEKEGAKKTKKTITATFKGAANVEGATFPLDIKLMS